MCKKNNIGKNIGENICWQGSDILHDVAKNTLSVGSVIGEGYIYKI